MKRIRVRCPKCRHEFVAQQKEPIPFIPAIPRKEWDAMWKAFDKLFQSLRVKF